MIAKFFLILSSLSISFAAKNAFKQLLLSKALDLYNDAQRYMSDNNLAFQPTPDYPYWNFMPQYVNVLKVGAPNKISWSTSCFANNEAAVTQDGKNLNVEIISTNPLAENCEDHYMTLCTSIVYRATPILTSSGDSVTTKYTLVIPDDVTEAEIWDIDTKGLRLMKYPVKTAGEAYSNLIKTFEMFIPELTLHIPKFIAEANIDFMSKYTHHDYPARDLLSNTPPPAHKIHSGDVLYVIRFDGLDPLLAWAMGSTTGHVTTAMWIDGQLYVCESTIADSYWPTDWIQKTPYETWIKQAIAADYLVVWAPLSDEARKNYNETAAVEYFKSQEGYDYGFQTMLWGWLDTPKGNFPCLPPDFSSNCIQWELLECLTAYVDRNNHEIGDAMWNAGLEKRLNVGNMRTSDLLMEAGRQGYQSVDVIIMPEQDSWDYNTTRYGEPAIGKAQVCCVFVCSTWKAAGVFGELADSINCAEQTNWDDYVLTVHAKTYEQILGSYTLTLNDYSTKDPYAHMGEKCDSLAPNYEKSATC